MSFHWTQEEWEAILPFTDIDLNLYVPEDLNDLVFADISNLPQEIDPLDLDNIEWSFHLFDDSTDIDFNQLLNEEDEAQIGAGLLSESSAFHINFEPVGETRKFNPKFHRQTVVKEFLVRHNMGTVDLLDQEQQIDERFGETLVSATSSCTPNDVIFVKIDNENLTSPIFMSYKKKQFSSASFLNHVYKVQQSNSTFLIEGPLRVFIEMTEAVSGSGNFIKKPARDHTERRVMKKCIVPIQNDNNACGYLAIALGIFYQQHTKRTNERDYVRKNKRNRLTTLAEQLCQEVGVDIREPLSISGIEKIANYLLPEYQLVIVNGITKTFDFIGPNAEKTIYVELIDHHYNLITSIAPYFDKTYFCKGCWKPYSHTATHRCEFVCKQCWEPNNCKGSKIECDSCKRTFYGLSCFNNHKKSVCRKRKRCTVCDVEYKTTQMHMCGINTCTKCGLLYKDTPHYCYITQKNSVSLKQEDNINKIIVSFDIESMLIKNPRGISKHVPILLIAFISCDHCFDFSTMSMRGPCQYCWCTRRIFYGTDCLKQFGDILYNQLSLHAYNHESNVYVFAHNFKGYDGHFIMQDIFQRNLTHIEPVMNGTKILKIDTGNIRFIDSLSFFQLPLSALPKSFGFEDKVVKGFFPHTFNTPDNQNYFGAIPSLEFFGIDRMKPEEVMKLKHWHESFRGTYNFKNEMIKYCESDTEVLHLSVMSFRKLFQDITSLDPITRNFTLASIGLETFRALYLRDSTIGITPISSYKPRNQSTIGSAWLNYMELVLDTKIRREYKIGNYWADGCIPERLQVFEFWGCYFHGCRKCYPNRREHLRTRTGEFRSVEDLYEITEHKKRVYRNLNFTIFEIWECDFKKLCETNAVVAAMTEQRKQIDEKLKRYGQAMIRESFFGGRTNNIRFWYEAQNGESIEYKDVCSEYPFVLKSKEYPIGHPVVITENIDFTLKSYFGFVKCKVLPPKSLFLPVLPYRFQGKLEFVLCFSCASHQINEDCPHSDEERVLIGTWGTPELLKAIALGYEIIDIYQVLHYPKKSTELFKEYMNLWIRIKQQSSGWPPSVNTEKEKDQYIQSFFEHEGVHLVKEEIGKNPGKRFISKLMLNSFWGKLAQRPNMTKTAICRDYNMYWSLINDDSLEIKGDFMPNDDIIIVNYIQRNEEDINPGKTNIAIASYVTIYARLHLYQFIEQVLQNGPDRLLYFDTDSVIYIKKVEDQEVNTGNYLGDLTDEIRDAYGPTARCIKFASCGPKNYGYEVLVDGERKTTIKTKGISINCETLSLVNLQTMTEIAKQYVEGNQLKIAVPQWQIKSDKFTHKVTSRNFQKVYRAVSEKRRIVGNGTLPYGYVGNVVFL